MNNIEQMHLTNTLCNVVRFDENDYHKIRHFILELCKELNDPSYFITDDIDSELPLLLKEKYGLVYGVVCGNEVVAIQAIDYDKNKTLNIGKLLGINIDNTIMEVGWAMVAPPFRKQNISVYLSKLLEQSAYKETNNENLAATVHPKNTNSVLLFLKLGYIGVKLINHFKVMRFVMIKNINIPFLINPKEGAFIVEHDNYEQQKNLLETGYVCHSAFVKQNNVYLKYSKHDCKKIFQK